MDHIEVKAEFSVSDTGQLEGIAWPYAGGACRGGDIILKGAVKPMAADLPMLRNHDPELVVGVWDEVLETDAGLIVKGHFNSSVLARATRSQIKTGQIGGLSIGFRDKGSTRKGRNRVINALDLYEVSIVKTPMHPGARLTGVKSYDQAKALVAAINNANEQLKGTT